MPQHVIISYCFRNEGDVEEDMRFGYMQAGDLSSLAQLGLLDTIKQIMMQDDD